MGDVKREIKFRAWDSKHSEMVYSDKEDCFYVNTKGAMFMYGNSLIGYTKSYELMQYTGLKDKNGVEIYEGDVVRANIITWSLLTMGEIIYDIEHSCYCNKNEAGITQLQKLDNFEVIGNIYENKGLLDG